MFTFTLYFIALYVAFYFFGYPFKLLYNEQLKKNDLFLTPWLGLCLVSLISIYLNFIGFHISQFAYMLIVFMFIINLFIYYKYRPSFSFDRKQLFFVVTTLVLSSIYLTLPLYINKLGLTSNIFLGNNDFVSYLYAIDYLTNNSMIDLKHIDGFPSYSQIYNGFFRQTRLSVMPISYFSYIFDLKPHQFTYLFTSFILYLNALAFSLFFNKKLIILFITFAIVLLNSNYQWLLYDGFIGQIFSIGLLVVIMYLFNEKLKSEVFNLKLLIIVSTVFVFYGANYPESFPYALLPIFLYFFFIINNKEKIILYLKNVIFIGLFILIFDYRIYVNVFSTFLALTGAKNGWDMPLAGLPQMLGLLNNDHLIPRIFNLFVVIVLNIILLGFVFIYLKINKFKSFYAIIIYSYLITYPIFIYKYDLYKIYKANISFTYIFIIAVISSLWHLSLKNKYYKYLCYGMISLILVLSLFSSSIFYVEAFIKQIDAGTITEQHEILSSIVNASDKQTNFYINVENGWNEMVAEYFTPMGKTYATSGAGYSGMKSTKIPSVNDIYITDSIIPDNIKMNVDYIYSNKTYQIYKISEKTIYNYEKVGLGPIQKNYIKLNDDIFVDTSRTFNDKNVTLNFNSKLSQKANLDIVLFENTSKQSNITILFNGKEIKKTTLYNSIKFSLNDLDFNIGSNQLIFQTDNYKGLNLGDVLFKNAQYTVPPMERPDKFVIYKKLIKFFRRGNA